MARVTGDENFFLRCAPETALAVRQRAKSQRRLNTDFLFHPLRQLLQLLVRQAKAPVLAVIRRPVRNPRGMVGK